MKLLDYLDREPGAEEGPMAGLSGGEAEQRLRQYGKNALAGKKKIRPFRIFLCQFRDFLTLILLGAAAVTLFLGDYLEAVTISAIVFCNGLMGFFQEYRTERTLEALRNLAAPKARVRRDGVWQELAAEELVPGDLIRLETGDKVPADGCLLQAAAFSADESILTGESVGVLKHANPDYAGENALHQAELVYMGTTVTAGRGIARVMATGMETQMGKIAGLMEKAEEDATPLQKKLDELGKYIAVGCLLICAVVAGAGILRGEDVMEMLLTGVSLAVAAVPEGLTAIVTISLALAVRRMVQKRSLVRRLHAVETLGCTDVICSDKTGTLTENKMTVRQIWTGGERLEVSGNGYQKAGEFRTEDGRLAAPVRFAPACRMLEIGVLCSNSAIQAGEISRSRSLDAEAGEYAAAGDPTEIALLIAAAKASVTAENLQGKCRRLLEIPFDSRRKCMSVAVQDRSGQRLLLVKGGADVLLRRCSSVQMEDGILPLDGNIRKKIEAENERMAGNALRVLGFAWKPLSAGKVLSAEELAEEGGLTFAGLAGMIDPPRREAKEAVALSRRAGIKTVMITGDHPVTACAVARELGIWHEGDRMLTGREISAMSEDELGRAVEKTTVFARVSPADKLHIVRAFRRKGHITAMTGDGVNDAPAVKEADIGVSMGVNGTDVTREASDLILLDDNFATLVAAVREGRVIYRNIRKFIRYLLACNIGEVLTMFLGMLMGIPVVLLPIHILLINLVTDGFPAVALGLDPPEKDVMKRAPRRASAGIFSDGLLTQILFRGALIGLTTLAVFLHFWQNTGNLALSRTAALMALVFAQLVHAFECRSEDRTVFSMNPFGNMRLVLAVLLSAAISAAAVWIPAARVFFCTVPLSGKDCLVIAEYLAAAPIFSAVLQRIFSRKPGESKQDVSEISRSGRRSESHA